MKDGAYIGIQSNKKELVLEDFKVSKNKNSHICVGQQGQGMGFYVKLQSVKEITNDSIVHDPESDMS